MFSRDKTTILLIQFLLLSFVIVSIYARTDSKISLVPIYPLSQPRFGSWQLQGSAYSLGDRIRLTGAEPDRVGDARNIEKIQSLSYFEASLEFSVHSSEVEGGEGLAVWITSKPLDLGSNFGGPDTWEGLMIVLETNQNSPDQSDVAFPRLAIHQNNGKASFEPETDGKLTYIGGCHFPFKKTSTDSRNSVYILMEDDNLHIFIASRDTWEKCVVSQKVNRLPEFYVGVSAQTSSKSDFHDVFKFAVSVQSNFEIEEESFKRPPITTLAPLLNLRPEALITRLMDVDDEDVVNEITDFRNWISEQLDVMKLTVGGQIIEINHGLDQLTQHTSEVLRQLEIVRSSTANLTSEYDKLASSSEKILKTDKPQNIEPINTLYSDLKKVESTSISISNAITSIQQDQNRRKSILAREKRKFETSLKSISYYAIIALFLVVVISVIIFLVRFLKSPKSKSSSSVPSWAA